MDYQININRTRPPAHDDAIWTFIVTVRHSDGVTSHGVAEEIRHQITDIELQQWAQERMGRSLHHTEGTQQELNDLICNWDKLEGRIKTDVERNLGRKLKS